MFTLSKPQFDYRLLRQVVYKAKANCEHTQAASPVTEMNVCCGNTQCKIKQSCDIYNEMLCLFWKPKKRGTLSQSTDDVVILQLRWKQGNHKSGFSLSDQTTSCFFFTLKSASKSLWWNSFFKSTERCSCHSLSQSFIHIYLNDRLLLSWYETSSHLND